MLISRRLLHCLLALFGTVTILVLLPPHPSPGSDVFQQSQKESILTFPIDSLKVEKGDMEEALRLLRRREHAEILIGFEKIPYREGEESKRISLDLRNTTVGQILDELCKSEPRYTYEVVDDVLINVFPKGSKSDPNNLLNMRISHFAVQGRYTAEGVINGISELAPELREYLWKKQKEYYAQKGVFPASPGSIVSGNMTPEFDLELRNLTVRQILNEIVLYSLKMYKERPPDPTGWRQPPTSWKYEFIIKPDATTGLGGIPIWDSLN